MAQFDIDPDVIRQLASLMEETGLAEVELEEGDRRLRLARGMPQRMEALVGPVVAAHPPTAAESAPAAPSPVLSGPGVVSSPMVGTVYLQPEPGSPSFVQVGASVKQGQTLLIIEAMKVMNPITAPVAGTVRQILVKDAQPVEFGELLMVIE